MVLRATYLLAEGMKRLAGRLEDWADSVHAWRARAQTRDYAKRRG
jgi:hypothetical protein